MLSQSLTLKVTIPKYHFKAVSYTLKCLLGEFLGLDYEIVASEEQSDFIISNGHKSLRISNIFFKNKPASQLYTEKNIPERVESGEILVDEKACPVVSIYGANRLERLSEHHLQLHADIVGSTFFMLSRWEEAVVDRKDLHNRFDYPASLAVKQGFYQRPVVNEYVDLLWELLRFLNPELEKNPRRYTCVATSDIDSLRKWKKPKRLFESIYINMKHGRPAYAFRDLQNYFVSQSNFKRDCYNNLDYLVEKTKGLQTIFYLKTGFSHPKHDKNRYRLEDYRSELNEAAAQNVKFGIHPHYNTFLSSEELQKEVDMLQAFLAKPVELVRQHYLRFSIPDTWNIQADAGLKTDSTMVYPHRGGFRNGVCYRFPVYDFKSDKETGLYESPLILMETSYLNTGFKHLITDAKALVQAVQKYRGDFVFLWHNGNLIYPGQRRCFEDLLEVASKV